MQTESVKYWTLKRILGYVLILILMPVSISEIENIICAA